MYRVGDADLSLESFCSLVVGTAYPSCLDPREKDPILKHIPEEFINKRTGASRFIRDEVRQEIQPSLRELAVELYLGGYVSEECEEGNEQPSTIFDRAARAIPVVMAGGWTDAREEIAERRKSKVIELENGELLPQNLDEHQLETFSPPPKSSSLNVQSYRDLEGLLADVSLKLTDGFEISVDAMKGVFELAECLGTGWKAELSNSQSFILIKLSSSDSSRTGQLFLSYSGELKSSYIPASKV